MIRFVFNMIEADKNNAIADKRNIQAYEKLARADKSVRVHQENASNAIEKLANRKRGLLNTSINSFLSLYERILKINFIESDGVKELSNVLPMESEPISMLQKVTIKGRGLSGAETAGAFFIKGGFSGIIAKEAEINMQIAGTRNREADIVKAQSEAICIALEYMTDRASKISDLLAKLNVLLVRSICSTSDLIEVNGYQRGLYTDSDKKQIMTCINLATTIKKIIDTHLIDQDGSITKEALSIIEIGNQALFEIEKNAFELGVAK